MSERLSASCFADLVTLSESDFTALAPAPPAGNPDESMAKPGGGGGLGSRNPMIVAAGSGQPSCTLLKHYDGRANSKQQHWGMDGGIQRAFM